MSLAAKDLGFQLLRMKALEISDFRRKVMNIIPASIPNSREDMSCSLSLVPKTDALFCSSACAVSEKQHGCLPG